MPQVAFTTLGCKVNQFETEVIEGLFRRKGYTVGPFEDTADIYVINTCSVTHLGEKKSRQLIRRANRTNPDAVIVVTGCYAQVSPDKIEAIEGVDVIVGTRDRQKIVDLAEEAARSRRQIKSVTDIMAADQFEDIPLHHIPGRTRAFLKIQEGCTNFCTYCIIPYARGPLRSRPLASINTEARKMVAAGFKEIVLTGIHLGAYGRDSNGQLDLIDAIKTVLDIPGLIRLRLGSLESVEVSNDLLKLMQQDPRVCPHLHLPLQAGSNDVLARMNRHYTIQEYSKLLSHIRSNVPNIAISTDIIVGFPGETSTIFEESLPVIERMEFSHIHIFPYSVRSGTPAANFTGQVPESEKKYRVNLLQRIADQALKNFTLRFVGHNKEIIFETETQGCVEGLTDNYIRVYSAANSEMTGQMKMVRLQKLYQDGLWGEII